ncbi:MAG: site-specific integrase [Desulfitobacteriaceae bacterium]|nr:site-specific integrase [Desulfitobacteriaceae bacterium]
MLKRVVDEETEHQKVKFIAEHKKEMSLAKDVWVLYQKHGAGLKRLTVDFTVVQQVPLRNELKHFLKNRFAHGFRTSDRMFAGLFDATNRLCKLNPQIRYFADIDDTDMKNLHMAMEQELTQSHIMTLISAMKVLFFYLCSDANDSSAPRPYANPFDRLRFVNAHEYHENTPYIPEMVVEALSERLDELKEIDRLVFDIFSETGMRAKEVAFLEAGCLENARYGDGETVILKFIPYKILKARRCNGLDDYQHIYIPKSLAMRIRKQIDASEVLRKEHDLPYIFLHRNKGYRAKILDVQYFATKINRLIQKYNICDESGQTWNFTSRQCRKTLAVNMIDKGSTTAELTYALGHLSQATAAKYYTEVRKRRLAELNTEFFREAFDVRLSPEQLSTFSEEERRMLYVDFRLGNRRVELGFCTRKLCEGACKSRSRTVHCVNCPQLCTGIKYLPYWSKLLESQRDRVRTLVVEYRDSEIEDYKEFIEYQQERRLLEAYETIVAELEKSEVGRS